MASQISQRHPQAQFSKTLLVYTLRHNSKKKNNNYSPKKNVVVTRLGVDVTPVEGAAVTENLKTVKMIRGTKPWMSALTVSSVMVKNKTVPVQNHSARRTPLCWT